ncbi:B12-binding domain-containing radical SAM protein [Candidatus Latescibacterota bacterium]
MDNNISALLLIMPPQSSLINGFAAGLISLANYIAIKCPKVTTDILDFSNQSYNHVKEQIELSCVKLKNKKLFVGITTTTASYQSALLIARMVRKVSPLSTIVLGGSHASADPENILRNHSNIVDLIIIGEGERALCELVSNYPALETIHGAAFIKEGKVTYTTSSIPLSQDELDCIPITFGDNGLIGTPGKFDHATYISARGCPLQCAFCTVGNDSIRTKSIPAVIRDIETLLDMGYFRIAIEDNFFAHSPTRTKEICMALKDIKHSRKSTFAWDCQTRVESLARKNTINIMAEAGCEAVYIGVESIHPEQLDYLNKTNNPVKYLQTLMELVIPSLLETNIECYLNLQFGIPGETVEQEKMTFQVLASLNELAVSRSKTITVFPQLHVVYPGTIHYHKGVAENRFPSDIFESFTEWEFQQVHVLNWLGEHFAHGTGGIPEGIFCPDLLREGRFKVNSEAVFRISTALYSINRLPGIKTFSYGDYVIDNKTITADNKEDSLVVNDYK